MKKKDCLSLMYIISLQRIYFQNISWGYPSKRSKFKIKKEKEKKEEKKQKKQRKNTKKKENSRDNLQNGLTFPFQSYFDIHSSVK